MVKELLVSFKDNLKSKTTNPFFGTLIVVWLFHNYQFVYTIFTFEKSKLPGSRLNYISSLLEPDKFLPNLAWCIGYAVIVLIATYILLNFSRLIVYLFDKKLTPWIKKITDSKSIVDKEKYDQEVKEKDRLQSRFDQEHEARLKLLTDYEKLDEKYKNLLETNNILSEKLTEEEGKGKKQSTVDELKPMSEKASALFDKFKPYLNDKKIVKQFKEVSIEILKTNWVSAAKDYNDLLIKGLIEVKNKDSNNNIKYSLTSRGTTFLEVLDHMSEEGNLIIRSFDDMVD